MSDVKFRWGLLWVLATCGNYYIREVLVCVRYRDGPQWPKHVVSITIIVTTIIIIMIMIII